MTVTPTEPQSTSHFARSPAAVPRTVLAQRIATQMLGHSLSIVARFAVLKLMAESASEDIFGQFQLYSGWAIAFTQTTCLPATHLYLRDYLVATDDASRSLANKRHQELFTTLVLYSAAAAAAATCFLPLLNVPRSLFLSAVVFALSEAMIAYLRSWFLAASRHAQYVVLLVAEQCVRLALLLFATTLTPPHSTHFLLISAAGTFCASGATLYLLPELRYALFARGPLIGHLPKTSAAGSTSIAPRLSSNAARSRGRELILFAQPTLLLNLFNAVIRTYLSSASGNSAVALLSATQAISMRPVDVIEKGISNVVRPIAFSYVGRSNWRHAAAYSFLAAGATLAAGLILAVAFWLAGASILAFLFAPGYAAAATALVYVTAGYAADYASRPLHAFMQAAGALHVPVVSRIIASVAAAATITLLQQNGALQATALGVAAYGATELLASGVIASLISNRYLSPTRLDVSNNST